MLILIIKLRKLARVEFNENNIVIKYVFFRPEKHILYSAIEEYQHIQRFKYVSLNVMKYFDNNSMALNKIHITTVVPNDDYNQFVRWIKKRN